MRKVFALLIVMMMIMPVVSARTYQVNESGETEFHYALENRTIEYGEKDVFIIDVSKGMEISMNLRLINSTSHKSGEMIYVDIFEGDKREGAVEASLADVRGLFSSGTYIENYEGEARIEIHADNTTTYALEIRSRYSILEAMGFYGLCLIVLVILASLIAVYHYASVKQKRDALREAGELDEDMKEIAGERPER